MSYKILRPFIVKVSVLGYFPLGFICTLAFLFLYFKVNKLLVFITVLIHDDEFKKYIILNSNRQFPLSKNFPAPLRKGISCDVCR